MFARPDGFLPLAVIGVIPCLQMLRVRTAAVILGGVLLTAGLGGCTAADRSGVGLSPQGVPVVANCGAWITGVKVFDDQTGRLVWSAHASSSTDSDSGLSAIRIGTFPPGRWTEAQQLALDPRPRRWRFDIDTGTSEPTQIVVRDIALTHDRVVRADGSSSNADDGPNGICGPDFTRTQLIVVAVVLGVPFIYAAVVETRRRRSKRRQLPA
jgi:hypothetical protein